MPLRRRPALRHDAGVRRRLPAREDRHARLRRAPSRSTSSTGAAPTTRCATCAASWSATGRRSARRPTRLPVFGTVAARFNDDGVTALYQHLRGLLAEQGPAPADRGGAGPGRSRRPARPSHADRPAGPVPLPGRDRRHGAGLPRAHRRAGGRRPALPGARDGPGAAARARRHGRVARPPTLDAASPMPRRSPPTPASLLEGWPALSSVLRRRARGDGTRTGSCAPTLAGSRCRARRSPGWRSPATSDHGELLRFLRSENLPGHFPFTAGVFPFKREGEDPARMFAGEGDAVPHQPAVPPACPRASRPPACRPPSTR